MSRVKTTSAKGQHTFVLDKRGLFGFGLSMRGQLGVETPRDMKHHRPIHVTFFIGKKIDLICCGGIHTLVKTSEHLYGFGDNTMGQLGLGNCVCAVHKPTLLRFFDDKEVEGITCGVSYTLVNTNKGLFGSGCNRSGELGILSSSGTSQFFFVCVEFFKGEKILKMCAGGSHTLVETAAGLFGFGANYFGELGTGDTETYLYPVRLRSFPNGNIEEIHCGANFTIVRTTAGFYGFGSNTNGQLSIEQQGWPPHYHKHPTFLPFFYDAEAICCGADYVIVKKPTGIYGVGFNKYGQLGTGTKDRIRLPTPIDFFRDEKIDEIYCGVHHTLVKTSTGVYGFGANAQGQLGIDDSESAMPWPQKLFFFKDKTATFQPRDRKKMLLLFMARELCSDSLLHDNYLPLDMFRLLILQGF